jgi:5'-3' exonuclease
MLDPNSPLAEYYPKDFSVDQNGKRMSWEAVVKIPFIDSKILLETLDSVLNDSNIERMLTSGEKRRNVEGEVKLYTPQSVAGRTSTVSRDNEGATSTSDKVKKSSRPENTKRVYDAPRNASAKKRAS